MPGIHDIIKFELFRTLRKKSFWFATIAPPIIMLAILGISYSSNNSAKKNSDQQNQTISQNTKIALYDDSGLINQHKLLAQNIILEPDKEAGIDAVKAGRIDAFFYYPNNVATAGVDIYAMDKGIGLTPSYDVAAIALLKQNVIETVGNSIENSQVVQLLQKDPSATITSYKNGVQTNDLADMIAPGFFAIVFLTILILLASIMITSTTEEKENRVAEILLTSVKAKTIIAGKILTIFILGLVQVVVIIVPLLVYYLRFKSRIALPGGISLGQIPLHPLSITIGLIVCVLGLIMYTGVLVGMGAMFPSARDASRFLGLTFIWAYIPIYSVALIISTPQALIVKVFTYFPLTAPTTVLLRNAVGSISLSEALLVIVILCAGATLAILFAVRAFRYGAMEYGRRISFKELLR